jgi:hypothetical protein
MCLINKMLILIVVRRYTTNIAKPVTELYSYLTKRTFTVIDVTINNREK